MEDREAEEVGVGVRVGVGVGVRIGCGLWGSAAPKQAKSKAEPSVGHVSVGIPRHARTPP